MELTGDIDRNTDDNMRVEYSAPLHLHRETAQDNFLLLLPKSQAVSLEGIEPNLALAKAYSRRMEWVRALVCLQRVLDDDPEHEEALSLLEPWRQELVQELDL